jgi:hypothetical protein
MNNYYTDCSVTAEQRRDRLQAAHQKELLRQAGVIERGWLCAILSQLGRLLVDAGQALQRYEAASRNATTVAPRMAGAVQSR